MGVVGRCAAHRTPARRYSTLSDFAAACYLLAGAPRAPSARRTYAVAVPSGGARRARAAPATSPSISDSTAAYCTAYRSDISFILVACAVP